MKLALYVLNVVMLGVLGGYYATVFQHGPLPLGDASPYQAPRDIRAERPRDIDDLKFVNNEKIRWQRIIPPPPPPTPTVPTVETPAPEAKKSDQELALEDLTAIIEFLWVVQSTRDIESRVQVKYKQDPKNISISPVAVGEYLFVDLEGEKPTPGKPSKKRLNGRILAISQKGDQIEVVVRYRFKEQSFDLTFTVGKPDTKPNFGKIPDLPTLEVPKVAPQPAVAAAPVPEPQLPADVPPDWDYETERQLDEHTWLLPVTVVNRYAETQDELLASVEFMTEYDENSRPTGIKINRVPDDHPARKYGAQTGDVIKSINGHPVSNIQQAREIGQRLSDQGVTDFVVVFSRRGELITKTFKYRAKKGEPAAK